MPQDCDSTNPDATAPEGGPVTRYDTRSAPPDIAQVVTELFSNPSERTVADQFNPLAALTAARAPGRLDVMGGIADYSGSAVLPMPLAESAVVLCQLSNDSQIRLLIAEKAQGSVHESFHAPLSDFYDSQTGKPHGTLHMRAYFQSLPGSQQWAAYIAGVITILLNEESLRLKTGLILYLQSSVPEGKGVSSSAAIEVAAMRAVCRALNLTIDPHRQAVLCQMVENQVVGAPCGLMDQMTSSLGVQGSLLPIRCQPDQVHDPVPLPAGLQVWGIDSGLRHAVSGADYGSVRVAAFMGYRILLDKAGLCDASVAAHEVTDSRWKGYLANIPVSEFSEYHEMQLPTSLKGSEFLQRYDGTTDTVTTINPDVHYAVRACTAHPVHEHFRVQLFTQLLQQSCCSGADSLTRQLLGECLYQSHASYSRCGLGSPGTDELIDRSRALGVSKGVYGARITGGGSGGTVALLAAAEAEPLVRTLAEAYRRANGMGGYLFEGSSPGACACVLQPC